MKCKKCGMELGQKNICPVCGPEKKAEKKPAAPGSAPQALSGFSKEDLAKIDEFVKAHPSDWNDEFEEFYDRQGFAANYRDTVSMCRHRAEIFAAVREMLKDAQKLSADLMIRIMDEIPNKYPEIDENTARVLAKEFFGGRKQIRQLILKDTALGKVLSGIVCGLSIFSFEGIDLSWKRKKNDRVNADDELCVLNSERLMCYIQKEDKTPAAAISKEKCIACGACVAACPAVAITFNDDKPEVDKDLCVLCEACLGACPVGAISINDSSTMPTVKSPWRGRIVSIRTEPVTKLDDVICEIETED